MVKEVTHTRESILTLLNTVMDPEVPVISIVELGIVRDVLLTDEGSRIIITPTYSGCPAMRMIEEDIRRTLALHGVNDVRIETILSPAWTTDWMDERTKEKLRAYGIAPPGKVGPSPIVQIELPVIHCPHCGSGDTEISSPFGSTACKSYVSCRTCGQPFEHFKAF